MKAKSNVAGTTPPAAPVTDPKAVPPKPGPGNAELPPVPSPPTEQDRERQRANQQAAHKAEAIMTGFVPMCLAMVLSGREASFTAHDCLAYLERKMDEYGNPASPTCRILIEQLVMAHHQAARLHARAAAATTEEATKILCAAAARLHAECRRTAVVIDEMLGKQPLKPKLKIARTA